METAGLRKLGSVIESQQFNREILDEVFRTAKEMETFREDILRGNIMVKLFYEPSTRTSLSFESAMKRLGGEVIGTDNASQFSSKVKGETLEDTIRIVSGYGNVIVLRYYKEGGAKRAQMFSSIPIINAGDGSGQHPTQALLDLYTIKKEFDDLEGLRIALIGDLANGRTVRSLCYLLAKNYPNNEIVFVSPDMVRMREDIKNFLHEYGVKWSETDKLDDVLSRADVFYQTRVQTERFQDQAPMVLEKVRHDGERLKITNEVADQMKPSAIIMHPLPRVWEIGYCTDKNSRARYFEQAQNGLYIRMALLKMVLLGY